MKEIMLQKVVILLNTIVNKFSEEDIDFLYRLGRKGTTSRPMKLVLINLEGKIQIMKS